MKYKTKLRKGDEVIVLAGKDKGKKGKILRILTENQKAIVSEINKVKKHKKPGNNEPGGIVDKEMPIQISNIAYFDAKSNKPEKIGFKISKDKKVRFNKNSGKEI